MYSDEECDNICSYELFRCMVKIDKDSIGEGASSVSTYTKTIIMIQGAKCYNFNYNLHPRAGS